MIKVTGADGIERIAVDGERYWPEEALKEAIGCKDDDIFGEIRKLKEERDVLKEKCDKLKARANAAYGTSCGYSGDKAPAFLCDVISYSWEFGPITGRDLMDEPTYRVRNDSIRVELNLTPTANYKGTIDMEDLKRYIQEYGREKRLGVLESVDYANAKAARLKLANLYKTVLGKEKLDRDLSPHEVMKAILDEYKRVRDSQLAFSQCLRSVYMHVCDGPDCKISDIYAAPDKLADEIITRYNSTRMTSRLVTLSEIDDRIDELCDNYNVVQPDRKCTTKERLEYIFSVLGRHRTAEDEYRDLANNIFKKAEGFRTEKRAVEDSLAELRAKIREIYRSIFCDCRWEDGYSYCSALNDIKEEYERVKYFFKEKNDELKEAKEKYSRYCLAVGSLCSIPAEHREDISWIEDAFNHSKKEYLKWQTTADNLTRFRSDVCTALCLGGERSDKDILKAIAEARKKCNDLIVFRNDVARAIGLTWTDSNSDIINRVMRTKERHDKLCEDYTELRKAIWEAMDRKPETLPDETARLVGEVRMLQLNYKSLLDLLVNYGPAQKILSDISEFRKWAIEELKQHGIVMSDLEYPERIDVTGSDIFRKLLKCYDWAYGEYKEQYRLRQMWHVRWESENERANGEHKRAEKLKNDAKCWTKRCDSLQTALNNSQNDGVALQAFRNECKKLREEKTKVIAALGQDIWDDCLK